MTLRAALSSMGRASREPSQAIHIPFSRLLGPDVVITKAGDLLATWKIAGLSFEGLSASELEVHMDGYNQLLRAMANGRFAFWIHRVRGPSAERLSVPPAGFARDLLERYQAQLHVRGLADTALYLTLVYRPTAQLGSRVMGYIGRDAREVAAFRRVALEAFEAACRQMEASLRDYGPHRLASQREGGITWSDQLAFYDFLINARWGRVAVKDVPLADYLPRSRKLFGNELIEIRDAFGSRFGSFLDLQDYADFTHPGILNSLFCLSGEYIETHSFSPMTRLDAAASLKRRIRQLSSTEDDAASQRGDLVQALDDLASGRFALGSYHYSLLILAATDAEVKRERARAADLLQEAGFRAAVVDVVPDAAYWAQLPGNWIYRPRVAELSSRNFAGLASLHNFQSGKKLGNPWGEALAMLRAPSGQPLYFNCHASDPRRDALDEKALASTQIIGQSGEGKTVFAAFLAASLSKYGAELVWFDKDHSAEILIRALGGCYVTLERGRETGLAPFKREASEAAVVHWIDLVKLCAADPHRPFTTREERAIEHAVAAAAALPVALRSFEAVLENLPKAGQDEVHLRLAQWSRARSGIYGWALDGPRDDLRLGAGIAHGFDYTALLGDDAVHPQVLMHLLYRCEEVIDGRRFVFFMEEYWKALENAHFEDFAKNKQKTIRKQNGFGVFLTQSPSDTLRSPIARTLIEQTATFVFLPNPSADHDDYVHGFKLTEAQFAIVRSLPRGSRLMLIKQGQEVALGALDLGGLPADLMVLAGSTADVRRLSGLRARLGDDPAVWMTSFLGGES